MITSKLPMKYFKVLTDTKLSYKQPVQNVRDKTPTVKYSSGKNDAEYSRATAYFLIAYSRNDELYLAPYSPSLGKAITDFI